MDFNRWGPNKINTLINVRRRNHGCMGGRGRGLLSISTRKRKKKVKVVNGQGRGGGQEGTT